ncbi:MAG: DMT family transporter [Chitinophagales bacterium]
MHWLLLIIAGLFETAFAFCLGKMKVAEGVAVNWWLAGFIFCLTMSMLLLYKATQVLPIGTAYAVWTGIGAAGTAVAGIVFFKESTEFWRIFFICLLIISIIGLKYTTPSAS